MAVQPYSTMWKTMDLVTEYPFFHCDERMFECPECGAHVCVLCMSGCDNLDCDFEIDFSK